VQTSRPKRQMQKNTLYDVQIVKIGPPVFCTAHPITKPSKILCTAMPFNRSDAQKVPITVGSIYTTCNTCSLDPPDSASQTASRSVHPFVHSSLQRVPILYNVRWNAINEQLKTSSAVAEMGDRLVTIDIARKEGAVPLSVGGRSWVPI